MQFRAKWDFSNGDLSLNKKRGMSQKNCTLKSHKLGGGALSVVFRLLGKLHPFPLLNFGTYASQDDRLWKRSEKIRRRE